MDREILTLIKLQKNRYLMSGSILKFHKMWDAYIQMSLHTIDYSMNELYELYKLVCIKPMSSGECR